ncbi:MAG TPA: porphobilinogen synthase [Candidatus Dormibacteraeota bacterium]|nr:porphobilinogen synthase [Candidatus Dormibacteraeota bacterium]
MRRLRRTPLIRELVREVAVSKSDLIQPLFVEEGLSKNVPISSMPGQTRFSLSSLEKEAIDLKDRGVGSVLLFGIPNHKDDNGSNAYDPEGIVQKSIESLKGQLDDEIVIGTDVCLCQYTSHGHCGIVKDGLVENDETLKRLAGTAVSHARAGADLVAPSAMIDGQVAAIREALDDNGFKDTGILAYAAKHSSSLFGPFREAAFSKPQFGDRRTYQMDYSNPEMAMREIALDIKEGADIIMVKPALAYLDIIYRAKRRFRMPMAAYNVSGEYAMLKAAAREGWIEEKPAILEVLTAIKRAGADMIITYHAKEAAEWLQS